MAVPCMTPPVPIPIAAVDAISVAVPIPVDIVIPMWLEPLEVLRDASQQLLHL